MESRVSLKGVLIAIMFFAVTVTMHEAARADGAGQGRDHFDSNWSQPAARA
jgi:hypothetical protein